MNFLSLYKRNLIFFLKKKINIDLHKNSKKLSLEELFVKYGSDKGTNLNNQTLGHGYTKFYLRHFKKKKLKKINILEIGSFAGASAAAFSIFFSNANIYCLDINISNFKYFSKRVKVFGLDATNYKHSQKFIKKFQKLNKNKKFDIIIDDGSHILGDILKVIRFYFQYLKNKGLYVIEDYKHPNYFPHLDTKGEPKIDKFIKYLINKTFFKSNILNKKFQKLLFDNLKHLKSYEGNLTNSNIVFFKKK